MSFSDKYRRVLEQVIRNHDSTRIDTSTLFKAFEKAGASVLKVSFDNGNKLAQIDVGSESFTLNFSYPTYIGSAHKSAATFLLIEYYLQRKEKYEEKLAALNID